MSTLVVDTLTNQEPQLCKAWVNFNGTGTVAIRASYNVSSITDNGTGLYTINFTNALSDTNYCFSTGLGYTQASASALVNIEEVAGGTGIRTATAFQLESVFTNASTNRTRTDVEAISVQIFR